MRNAFIDVGQLERAVAADFQFPALTSCTVIGHAFNDTYLLRTGAGRFICRVYLNGKYYIEDSADFLFELELLEFVWDRGVSVAAPVRRRDGALLGRLSGHDRVYAVFEYAAGEQAETLSLTKLGASAPSWPGFILRPTSSSRRTIGTNSVSSTCSSSHTR